MDNRIAQVPGMSLVERLRFPLVAAEKDQSFFDADKALRNAAADEIERLLSSQVNEK